MLTYEKDYLKEEIEGIYNHLIADGNSSTETRIYYDVTDGELTVGSNVGSNWYINNDSLVVVGNVSQNVDLEEWFELPRLRDEEGNNIGVWWEDDPKGTPFTELDFFEDVFWDFIKDLFISFDGRYYDHNKDKEIKVETLITSEESNKLSNDIHDILSELKEELELDNKKPLLVE